MCSSESIEKSLIHHSVNNIDGYNDNLSDKYGPKFSLVIEFDKKFFSSHVLTNFLIQFLKQRSTKSFMYESNLNNLNIKYLIKFLFLLY